jgi:hypothetical protein
MRDDDITNYPTKQRLGGITAQSMDKVEANGISAEPWTLVTIDLTAEQQQALTRLTGERLVQLKILVEDLVDLGDLVAN